MPRLTGSQMKYLHVIYMAQEDKDGIRSVDIARELGITKASVSRMVKLLTESGYISMGKYGIITLTPKGKSEGMEIHENVKKVYHFFADCLELEESEARESAYSFLCGFSDNCIKQLAGKGWAVSQSPL